MIQYKDFVPIYPYLISEGDEIVRSCDLHWATEMKPRLSRNMLPNINTCENGRSNFSANLRVVSLKSLELTQFAWPNLLIYFNFSCAVLRDDVIESTRFLMRPRVIIPPWYRLLNKISIIEWCSMCERKFHWSHYVNCALDMLHSHIYFKIPSTTKKSEAEKKLSILQEYLTQV